MPTRNHSGMADDRPPNDAADRPRSLESQPADTTVGGRTRPSHVRRRGLDLGRSITTAAIVVATVAGASVIAIIAGLLTLFGWGVAVVVALLSVGAVTAVRPRPANAWLLVPLLALALPSAAVAISGVRVLPQWGPVLERPSTADQIPNKGYRAGFGDLLVDLRSLEAHDGDRIVIPAGSDLGRTIVALPQKRCFNLDVRWQTGKLRLPRVRERRTAMGFFPAPPAPGSPPTRSRQVPLRYLGGRPPAKRKRIGVAPGRAVLFGRVYGDERGRWVAPARHAGAPTLTLELASKGGSFVVRDYPDHASPLRSTDWPIDQRPPRPSSDKNLAKQVEIEEEMILAGLGPVARRRAQRGVRVEAEAHRVMYVRQLRQDAERQDAFARGWARRVRGTCNLRGAFR